MEVVGKDIQNFQLTVKQHSDYDFSDYSHTSLRRRLTRILLELEMDMDQLCLRMQEDPDFLQKIMRKITVHTTEMFRDPEVWMQIKNKLLPRFKDQDSIRIWHPGCSTGQELYSMMMVLDELGLLEKTEIYGSDLHQEILDTARKGLYRYRFNQIYLENFDRVMLERGWELFVEPEKTLEKIFPHR